MAETGTHNNETTTTTTNTSNTHVDPATAEAVRHWGVYGQPGTPQTTRTRPEPNQAHPFSKPTPHHPWRIPIQPADFLRLLMGFQSGEMEDKWLVYADGPDGDGVVKVHMHRSWTGYEIVELTVVGPTQGEGERKEKEKGGYWITEVRWETDEERFYCEGLEQIKETARGVCNWVLGVELGPEEVVVVVVKGD